MKSLPRSNWASGDRAEGIQIPFGPGANVLNFIFYLNAAVIYGYDDL
jgi:hypothetical protein